VIGTNSGILIDFKIPMPVNGGCKIGLVVPPAMSTNLKTTVKYIYVQGAFGVQRSLPFSFEANMLMVKSACESFIKMGDERAVLKVKYLMNPNAVRDTENFKLIIMDNKGNLIAETTDATKSFYLSKTNFLPGTLQMAMFLPDNNTVSEFTDWMMQI
jgi:hypothetical protein